ncbi:MAG: signal peptidase I [Clostridia bacterium]|nr:signal peptidase I [Clostridia bacterium]
MREENLSLTPNRDEESSLASEREEDLNISSEEAEGQIPLWESEISLSVAPADPENGELSSISDSFRISAQSSDPNQGDEEVQADAFSVSSVEGEPLFESSEADQVSTGTTRCEAPSSGRKGGSAVSPIVEFMEIIVGALVAAILVLTLICRTGVVDGTSMVPTMHHADRYVISDLFYTPDQGDIVVFRPEMKGEDELWIKRIIALEGQTVYIDPNTYQVFVDGQLLDEPYLEGMGTIPKTTENPITVPEGCVFVMGDNRAISLDSRYKEVGCVKISQLAGRVILRFWPLSDFGFCE